MMDNIIGRENECATISGLINQRKSIIIFGPEGVGKTAIINKVLSGFSALNKLHSASSKTLKESLLNFSAVASPIWKETFLILNSFCKRFAVSIIAGTISIAVTL